MKKSRINLSEFNMNSYSDLPLFMRLSDIMKKIFIRRFKSKKEKIYILKDTLIKIYRDYEKTTGIRGVPYYIRAEIKLNTIIKERKVDYYYNLLYKLRNTI